VALVQSTLPATIWPNVGINHLAELACLQFRGTVSDYQEAFLAKLVHAGYLSPEQQVRLFTGGLPYAIRVDVELQAPQDLQRAMALARAYEQQSSVLAAATTGGWPPRPPTRFHQHLGLSVPTHSPSVQHAAALSATAPQNVSAPSVSTAPKQFKKLTAAEMMKHRRLGLCYNCDEQYTRGHKCEVTDSEEGAPSDQMQHNEEVI
jgi:hypothetical protein